MKKVAKPNQNLSHILGISVYIIYFSNERGDFLVRHNNEDNMGLKGDYVYS